MHDRHRARRSAHRPGPARCRSVRHRARPGCAAARARTWPGGSSTASRRSRPGIDGIVELLPTATTMFLALQHARLAVPSPFATRTRPGPSICAVPRRTTTPASSNPLTWLESSGQSMCSRLIIQSRRSDAWRHEWLGWSTWTPASWSSDLDGMHAQNAHEPPTSSRSTTATLAPRVAGEVARRLPRPPRCR